MGRMFTLTCAPTSKQLAAHGGAPGSPMRLCSAVSASAEPAAGAPRSQLPRPPSALAASAAAAAAAAAGRAGAVRHIQNGRSA